MDDDFNTPKAIGHIFELIRQINPIIDAGQIDQDAANQTLALMTEFNTILGVIPDKPVDIPPEVRQLVDERESARQAKDFPRADELRQQVKNLGYDIDDTIYGPLIKRSGTSPLAP